MILLHFAQVAQLFVFAHRSRTKTRATQVNYKKVSYFELQRIFMSSMPKRVEIKQPGVTRVFVSAQRARTKSQATRIILDI